MCNINEKIISFYLEIDWMLQTHDYLQYTDLIGLLFNDPLLILSIRIFYQKWDLIVGTA